jgi:uncharacterized protein (TIGR00255 family)
VLKSMTGFGRGEYLDEAHHLTVEIKAVNHRFNEIVVRMPKNLGSLEDKIRRAVSKHLVRGRIDVFITFDEYSQKKYSVRVDKELAIAYHNSLKELADLFALPMGKDIFQIANYPDVIRVEEQSEDVNFLWPKISTALDTSVASLLKMRLDEGANIERDLSARVDKVAGYVSTIEQRAPAIITEYRDRLLGRMKDLLSSADMEPDETRLLQETALFAERINFTEEVVRLRSHLSQFKAALSANEPVGRKLDFIVQEINRETNTVASKTNDYSVANVVVEIKSEIEKIREQIQNIE